LEGLEEAQALDKRVLAAGGKFKGYVRFDKGHLSALRQRLYDSLLDDGCAITAAGEREKLARVSRARATMGRLAHACRPEIVGREEAATPDQPLLGESFPYYI
jgi:hypothetical protein